MPELTLKAIEQLLDHRLQPIDRRLSTIEKRLSTVELAAATKADLAGFAAKADLEGLATKRDLERFATKKDFEGLATKADLERFATKDDLVSETRSLKVQLVSIETKVDRLSVRMEEEHAAVVKDAERLTGRVQTIEKQIGKLKPQPAV